MNEDRPTGDMDSLSDEQLARVDELCDQFYGCWRDGKSPRIEDFLPDDSDPASEAIFAELLQTEIELVTESHSRLNIPGLYERFPDKSHLISDICGTFDETLCPNDASTSLPMSVTHASEPRQSVSPPERLGRYRIERPLGRGAMGAVYLAVDEKLDRQVAVKIPHIDPEREQLLAERFEREARTMAAIKHQNLCTIFDVGTIDGTQFLTMEFVDGCTLAERLRSGEPLTSEAAASLIGKVARALQLAHDVGVVHRDLKPGNILLRRNSEEPVVTDFGLARRVALVGASGESSSSDTLTGNGTIIGTPAYLSPEQAEGSASEIGFASDIYSLGVVLYELLAGRVPFQGSAVRVIGCHVSQDPDLPSEHREGIDPRLEQLCLKALAKQPNDRFASVGEFADALDDILAPSAEPNWVARGLFATAAILLAVVMTMMIRTDHGTLVVEISDPQILATTAAGEPSGASRRYTDMDGIELTLRDRKTGINYTVGPGTHELPLGGYTVRLTSDSGLDVDAREFQLFDGEDARVRIFMKPAEPQPPTADRSRASGQPAADLPEAGAIVESLPYYNRMDIAVIPGDRTGKIALANGTTYSPQAGSFQEGSDGSFRFYDEEEEATLYFGAVGQFLKATVEPDTVPVQLWNQGLFRQMTESGAEVVKGSTIVFRGGSLQEFESYTVASQSGAIHVFDAENGQPLETWTRVDEAPTQFADLVTAWMDGRSDEFTMEDLSYQVQGSHLLVWGNQNGDEELPMSALFGPTSTGEIKWLRLDRTNILKNSLKRNDTLKPFKNLQKELKFKLESAGIRIVVELYDEVADETITGLNKADFFVNADEEGPIVRLSYNKAEGEPVSSIRYDDRMTPPAE